MMHASLYKVTNFSQLQQEVSDLMSYVGDDINQIICQTRLKDTEDFATGIGRIDELEEQDEHNYKYIQPILKGTLIEKLIEDHAAFRTRIIKLGPRSCYSVHRDPSPRIHIPIFTNEQCWMIWPYRNVNAQLHEGQAYWTDTRKRHSFFNGHQSMTRVHLVMVID